VAFPVLCTYTSAYSKRDLYFALQNAAKHKHSATVSQNTQQIYINHNKIKYFYYLNRFLYHSAILLDHGVGTFIGRRQSNTSDTYLIFTVVSVVIVIILVLLVSINQSVVYNKVYMQ